MMGGVSSEDSTTLDETGSDRRGGFIASLPVTDDAALMAFNDDVTNLKSRLCSRGDYHVHWYNLRWIKLCLSPDRIVFII
eukprot:989196-Rhodomonas_salina.1